MTFMIIFPTFTEDIRNAGITATAEAHDRPRVIIPSTMYDSFAYGHLHFLPLHHPRIHVLKHNKDMLPMNTNF